MRAGGTADNPYFFQQHVYDKDHPDNFAFFLARIRALLDEFGITTTVGEVGSDDPSMAAQYTQRAMTSFTWPTALIF